jgi:hypothetical protein
MIRYKNNNFNVNEDFVMFLISKLILCFIYGSTSRMKSQSIAYLPIGSTHNYWILDLEGEVYSIWDLWSSGLHECKRQFVFLKLSGAGNMFRSGSKNSLKGYPIRI